MILGEAKDSDLNGLSPAIRDEFSGHLEQALEASKGDACERGEFVQCRVAFNPISITYMDIYSTP